MSSSTLRTLANVTAAAAADASSSDNAENQQQSLACIVLFNLFLFLLIFGLSATVDIHRLKAQLTNFRALGSGLAMQFIVMPLLGYLSILCFQNFGLTTTQGISLLVVTSSPGGTMSNWWCSLFNADLALSVGMTGISTIFSIFLLPLNLVMYSMALYGRTERDSVFRSLDWKSLMMSLGIVIGGIAIGILFSCKFPRIKTIANRLANVSGIVLAGLSVWLMDGSSYFGYSWSFYVGVALPCILGLLLSNLVGLALKLVKPQVMTISIECCFQNALIATSVSVNMFADSPAQRAQALAVPVFYALVQSMVTLIYCLWGWKMGWTKAPKDEKLCVVVTNSYELQHEHDDSDDNNDTPQDDDDDDDALQMQPSKDEQDVKPSIAWWARPFVPRYPQNCQGQQQDVVDDEFDVEAQKEGDPQSETSSTTDSQLSDEEDEVEVEVEEELYA